MSPKYIYLCDNSGLNYHVNACIIVWGKKYEKQMLKRKKDPAVVQPEESTVLLLDEWLGQLPGKQSSPENSQ